MKYHSIAASLAPHRAWKRPFIMENCDDYERTQRKIQGINPAISPHLPNGPPYSDQGPLSTVQTGTEIKLRARVKLLHPGGREAIVSTFLADLIGVHDDEDEQS